MLYTFVFCFAFRASFVHYHPGNKFFECLHTKMKLGSSAVRILLVSYFALKHSATAQSQECLNETATVNNALPDDLPEGPDVDCDDEFPVLVCAVDESSIESQFVSACENAAGKAYAVDISVDCTDAGGGSALGIEEVQYDFMNLNVCVGINCTSDDLDALGQTRLQETGDFTEELLTNRLGTTFSCVATLDTGGTGNGGSSESAGVNWSGSGYAATAIGVSASLLALAGSI